MSSLKWCKKTLKDKRIFIYGIGQQSRYCMDYVRKLILSDDVFLFDSDSRKWGVQIQGKRIYKPEEMKKYFNENTVIIIGAIKNQFQIAEALLNEWNIPKDRIISYLSDYYNKHIYCALMIEKNMDRIKETCALLEDEESKEYYWNAVNARIYQDPFYLKPNKNVVSPGEYGDKVCLEPGNVIVDCGAYTGDTAEMYMKRLDNDCKIHAIEPFLDSYKKLCENIERNHWKEKVYPYQVAVGALPDEKEIIYDRNDFKMRINLNEVSGDSHQRIEVETLDRLLRKLDKVDYIKMDIEGEEAHALWGAAEIIAKHKPKLMISGYHKIEDIWQLPELIKKINPAYKIYAGHEPNVSMEIEFYCI